MTELPNLKILRSSGSLGAARVWGQTVQFVGFVLAARVVGPEAFGVYALIYLACAFLMLVAGLGWSEYAMTYREGRAEALWVAQIVGLSIGILFIISGLYLDPTLHLGVPLFELMFLLGCFMPLRATTALQYAFLIADRKLGAVAKSQFLAESFALFALVAGLYLGLGILSLGVAKIAEQIVSVAFAYRYTGRIFGSLPRCDQLPHMLRFASRLQASGFAHFSQENVVTMLVGFYFGAAGTGIYRAGARFPAAVSEVIAEPMRAISWSSFTHPPGSAELRESVLNVVSGFLSLAAALLVCLAIVAPLLVDLLLGAEWSHATPIIILLCIRRLLIVWAAALPATLAKTEQIHLSTRVAFASAGLSIFFLSVMAPFGLVYAAVGQVIAGIFSAALLTWAFNRAVAIRAIDLLLALRPAAISCCAMGVVMWIIVYGADDVSVPFISLYVWDWARLFGGSGIGIMIYCVSMLALSPLARKLVQVELPMLLPKKWHL